MAKRQRGVVSHAQLLQVGYPPSVIHRAVARGRLCRLYQGVYAVGHPVVDADGRLVAALLACGEHAAIAYRSAAAMWDVRRNLRARIDVLTASTGHHRLAGIDRHVTRRLRSDEVTMHRGIRVTTPSRTLADLAGVVRYDDLRRTLERADALELLDVRRLLSSVEHRPGARKVRAILAAWAPAATRSRLEDRLLMLLLRSDLPEPQVNRDASSFEVDLRWPEHRLVVEADSYEFHATWAAMERDRHRDAVLAADGIRVLRFTWRQVTQRPDEVLRAIRAAMHLA